MPHTIKLRYVRGGMNEVFDVNTIQFENFRVWLMNEPHRCSWLYNAVLLYRKELLWFKQCVLFSGKQRLRRQRQSFNWATCKRTQHCWMLHAASVCTPCCMLLGNKLETSQTFSYVQRDATTPNIVGSSLTWKNWVGLSFSISNPFASWPSKEVYYYSSFKKLFGFQMRFLGF